MTDCHRERQRGEARRLSIKEFAEALRMEPFDTGQNIEPATLSEIETAILEISMANPCWGCALIQRELLITGKKIDRQTIQCVLIRHRRGTRIQRCGQEPPSTDRIQEESDDGT